MGKVTKIQFASATAEAIRAAFAPFGSLSERAADLAAELLGEVWSRWETGISGAGATVTFGSPWGPVEVVTPTSATVITVAHESVTVDMEHTGGSTHRAETILARAAELGVIAPGYIPAKLEGDGYVAKFAYRGVRNAAAGCREYARRELERRPPDEVQAAVYAAEAERLEALAAQWRPYAGADADDDMAVDTAANERW